MFVRLCYVLCNPRISCLSYILYTHIYTLQYIILCKHSIIVIREEIVLILNLTIQNYSLCSHVIFLRSRSE